MCLDRDRNPLQKATEDIVCYKVISFVWKERFETKTKILNRLCLLKRYESYCQNTPVTLGEISVAEPAYTKKQLEEISKHGDMLDCGFIHSFKNKGDAIAFKKSQYFEEFLVIVKCSIPKDTYYFTGLNNGNTDGYASCSLKYEKVIG